MIGFWNKKDSNWTFLMEENSLISTMSLFQYKQFPFSGVQHTSKKMEGFMKTDSKASSTPVSGQQVLMKTELFDWAISSLSLSLLCEPPALLHCIFQIFIFLCTLSHIIVHQIKSTRHLCPLTVANKLFRLCKKKKKNCVKIKKCNLL